MKITAAGLNRATLARQLLLQLESNTISEAIRQIVALQAQRPPWPYLALWNRVANVDPGELDSAFIDGTVIKAPLMRVTLHAVHRDVYRPFREAVEPTLRAQRL